MIVAFVTMLYGTSKLTRLFQRGNPSINTYVRKDSFLNDEKYLTKDENFMMAFSLEKYWAQKGLYDPRFIKWYAQYVIEIDGVYSARELPVYPCTEADYAKFYPVDRRGESRLRRMKENADSQLFCIDWQSDTIELYGTESTGNYGAIDITVVPCNLQLTNVNLGGLEDRISE